GDGLVSQIPALILSVGAGILVTRASENSNLGAQLAGQMFRYPRAMRIAAGMLACFGLMPGMPMVPFFTLAGLAAVLGKLLADHQKQTGEHHEGGVAPAAKPAAGGKASKPGESPAAAAGAPSTGAPEDVRKLTDVDV